MESKTPNVSGAPGGGPAVNQDLAGGMSLLIWIVPIVVMGITAGLAGPYRLILWLALLIFMGAACLVNALRCRRLHCYVTAPFFLLLAVATLLYGFGLLPLGPRGWQWLWWVTAVGACLLTYLPEWLFGRYRHPGTRA